LLSSVEMCRVLYSAYIQNQNCHTLVLTKGGLCYKHIEAIEFFYFSLPILSAPWLWGLLSPNRNENQDIFLGAKV
jgi:hypothetical protein